MPRISLPEFYRACKWASFQKRHSSANSDFFQQCTLICVKFTRHCWRLWHCLLCCFIVAAVILRRTYFITELDIWCTSCSQFDAFLALLIFDREDRMDSARAADRLTYEFQQYYIFSSCWCCSQQILVQIHCCQTRGKTNITRILKESAFV